MQCPLRDGEKGGGEKNSTSPEDWETRKAPGLNALWGDEEGETCVNAYKAKKQKQKGVPNRGYIICSSMASEKKEILLPQRRGGNLESVSSSGGEERREGSLGKGEGNNTENHSRSQCPAD